MLWAPFFHIYQPPDQNLDILERIVNESYRPLISDWLANPGAKATININACLTELMVENKYLDVIFGLKKLLERKQIEITASAKYHPFLPILPRSEIIRQIELNEETNRQVFGSFYNPQGFFPPEMGYSREVGDVVREMGYEWIILDEIAYNGKVGQVEYDRLYRLSLRGDTFSSHERGDVAISPRHSGLLASLRGRSGSRISRLPSRQVDSGVTRFGRVPQNDDKSRLLRFARNDNLYVFFRERRMSNLIMAAMIRSPESLAEALGEEVNRNRYLITAMDAETFGHHRPGLDKMLSSLYQGKNYKLTTISELLECFKTVKELDPIA
ncbi:hypothetical protein HY030_02985, partial [Candidatus Gottesmanbacteria bacterium]|nr:hypothetical protein [Candidatus Gottesmanbacteria bacterium]